jgi:hypothetical protein
MEKFKSENLLKEREYLKPGIKAIVACLGTGQEKGIPEALTPNDIEFINIDTDPKDVLEKGFSGEYIKPHWAYVMSPVDSAHKFSMRYVDCTGIIAVGVDSKTGENISFLTHQNPNYIMFENENFLKDLDNRLEEIKSRCEEGTVDVVIFGGRFSNVKEKIDEPNHPIHGFNKDLYIGSIDIVAKEIKDKLGFSPTVISGPKFNPGQDQVVFDTIERRMYFERIGDYDANFIRNFDAEDLDEKKSEFTLGEWPLS